MQSNDDLDLTFAENEENNRAPGLLTILIVVLVIVSLIGTLVWPIIYDFTRSYRLPPTPTAPFLQEAYRQEKSAQAGAFFLPVP